VVIMGGVPEAGKGSDIVPRAQPENSTQQPAKPESE